MFLSCFTLMQIIPGLLSGYSFRLASVSYCHDPSFFEHLSHSLAQDVLGSPFLSPAPLRNQDVNARCAHQLRESLFPGPLCRWVRGCRWVMCMCVCKHTCLHLFILTDVKRRSLFNYIPLHLSYTLKTMSSPTPPTLIQCHRFPLILSLFCIYDPLLPTARTWSPVASGHPSSWIRCSSPYCHWCSQTLCSEALHWVTAPVPQGSCFAWPHRMSFDLIRKKGGRSSAFSLSKRSPQLPQELLSCRSALVPDSMCYIIFSVICLYCHDWHLISNKRWLKSLWLW